MTGNGSAMHGSVPPPVFFISTGRTGTRFLAEFFGGNAVDALVYHTLPGSRLVNVLGSLAYRGAVSPGTAGAAWERICGRKIAAAGRQYIECNPYYYNVIPRIAAAYPDVRIIHLVRHPKSFVTSHIQLEEQRWQNWVANKLVPAWVPLPYREQLKGINGAPLQRVRFYAKIWNIKNRVITAGLAGVSNARRYRFEDLFKAADGHELLAGICDWAGIRLKRAVTPETFGAHPNRTVPKRGIWNDECGAVLAAECGEQMKELGYGD